MKLRHEMNHMPEVVNDLHWGIRRVLEPLGWKLDSKLGGYNSYWLHHATDTRQFHFRWYPSTPGKVFVYDRYYNGAKVATIATQEDVLRFLVKVRSTRKVKVTL